ncbi:C40 family peptidase [Thermoflavimicrobium dichotomicum]|uniref:Mannosyl-glycoprotein endo-beta-N-acetylglucosaminidase n=1 Tax=Thermoflavimicrobium dichotomicum TaxID=46223 RepID=A0A1I3K6S5_9BACL|nr:C40 family peptidase [Thermoflavimicrobium dichotomicum]SFI68114.1 Mannosyl-glycoprotein endo-beta-N-acetylglucosaminidase [Thermoflavimicrobium dichotomicum]
MNRKIIYSGIGVFFFLFLIIAGSILSQSGNTPGSIGPGGIICRPNGQEISVEELNAKLQGKGVFENKAAVFIEAGRKYGVDPVLVAAIALFETGNGTSNAVRNYNNPGGLMDPNNTMVLQRFPTLEAGIEKMTWNLYKNYISQGLTTPDKIGPKYAPPGAANDPNGTNHLWPASVTKFVNQLGGLTYHCTPVASIQATGNIKAMLEEAVSQIGVINYIFGADNYPNFDCSSWVQYMFKRHFNIQLPRTAEEQSKMGVPVDKSQLMPGDLVFLQGTYKAGVSHVGIYMGNGKVINNKSSSQDLQIDDINSPYYIKHWHSARRIVTQQ